MSTADELTKLNDLKGKGILSSIEFEKEKAKLLDAAPRRSRYNGLLWKIPLAFMAIICVNLAFNSLSGGIGLPKCESDNVNNALQDAFTQSQFARTLNLSAIEIGAIKEGSTKSPSGKRECSALVVMNNTEKVHVHYALEARENGKYILTFEVTENEQHGNVHAISQNQDKLDIPPPQRQNISRESIGLENAKIANTRFGALTVSEANVLLFRGIPVKPEILGNNSLDLLAILSTDSEDVVFVRDNGGTACNLPKLRARIHQHCF